jgi:hypothetical protein
MITRWERLEMKMKMRCCCVSRGAFIWDWIGDRRRPAEEGGVEGRAAVWIRWGVTRGHTQIDPF